MAVMMVMAHVMDREEHGILSLLEISVEENPCSEFPVPGSEFELFPVRSSGPFLVRSSGRS
jgi:hypothetical protein